MTEEELEPVSPLALPARKPARTRHQPTPKKVASMTQTGVADNPEPSILIQLRSLGSKIEDQSIAFHNLTYELNSKAIARTTVEEALNNKNAEIKDVLAISDDTEPRPTMLRRRTQDEMLRALHLLASGQQRPRDDDSPAVLEDAIYEVADLRQIVADLMQGASNMYQGGMASIRKMTER